MNTATANASAGAHVPASEDTAAPAPDAVAPAIAAAMNWVGAWSSLLNREIALARRSLHWLLVGAIALPVIALSAWLGLSALLVAVVHIYISSWALAILIGVAAQVVVLVTLLRWMRRWLRDLTLPQSRAALVQAMERMT
ncbi:MAG: hypothetical protein ABI304_03540 [Rudaea sp.]